MCCVKFNSSQAAIDPNVFLNTAIQQLENAGCLHRDISINNVVLAINDEKLVQFLKSQGVECYSSVCADMLPGKIDHGPSQAETSVNDTERNKMEVFSSSTVSDILTATKNNTSLPEEVRKRLEGFLIDFDYSIFVDGEDISALADRTVSYLHIFCWHPD